MCYIYYNIALYLLLFYFIIENCLILFVTLRHIDLLIQKDGAAKLQTPISEVYFFEMFQNQI